MHEGLKWEWESFGEYLSALERRQRDMDICALLPHAAVRVFVMGERALQLENANQADIAQMRQIAAEAMRQGAFGFSTSRSLSHKTLKGDPTPTLRAQEDELTGIAMGMKDAPRSGATCSPAPTRRSRTGCRSAPSSPRAPSACCWV